jgi:hypothetical protein
MDIAGNEALVIVLTRAGVVKMVAEVQSVEYVGDQGEHTLAVTAMSSMWVRLAKALVGKGYEGLKGPTSATDQGTWLAGGAGSVLAGINAESSAHTWITTNGTITASGNISGGVWRYTPLMDIIQELSASTSGFDFWQDYTDPRNGSVGTASAGSLNIAPVKGTTKNDVVFEYGTENPNSQSYRFLVDVQHQINRAISLPPSFPDSKGLPIVTKNEAFSQAAFGVREEVISTELSNATLRGNIAQAHVDLRAFTRKIFEIQPMPGKTAERKVPEALIDYVVGDTVRGRVKDRNKTLIDALVRVYGITVEPQDDGVQVDTLTLVPE